MTVDDRRCRPSASPRYGSIAARRRDSNRLRLGKPWDGRHRGPKKSGYDDRDLETDPHEEGADEATRWLLKKDLYAVKSCHRQYACP